MALGSSKILWGGGGDGSFPRHCGGVICGQLILVWRWWMALGVAIIDGIVFFGALNNLRLFILLNFMPLEF
ncbi:hypothetical protein [Bartonella sp. AA168HLJHH]|uniref:hypothetical protein n=1 Tax=Bartonella sp. AA168HLJHH TaxID=3243427 RepID=UPI0035D03D36